jgi:creatinine amidohydrolase
MELEWARLKASELRTLAQQDAIVLVPVAAMEQHGPHLPVMVDSLLCAEVALRAARRVAECQPIVVAPTVWSGLSEHHMPLGGTFTLDFQTFFALLRCLCASLVTHGFRRIFLLNGHGGNRFALRVVVDELSGALGAAMATATYWEPAAGAIARILEQQPGVQHACEAETSMVMALRPELVDAARFAEARFDEAPHTVTQRGAHVWRSFPERTPTGVIGDPTAASAAKGERLLDAAAETIAELLLDDDCWVHTGSGSLDRRKQQPNVSNLGSGGSKAGNARRRRTTSMS